MLCGLPLRYLLLAGLWVVLTGVLPAQATGDLHFERILLDSKKSNKRDNLSAVRAITKDKYGFVWIGGENGLARYDGNELIVYQTDPQDPHSISANYIWALITDRDGVMWIGTGRGLNRYNPDTNNFDRFTTTSVENHVADDNINALAVDQQNNLLIGTANGISVLNPERTLFRNYPYLREGSAITKAYIRELFVDSHNRIWVGTSDEGLGLFNLQTGLATYFLHDPQDPHSLIDNDVNAIREDGEGRLWVGTYGRGLSRMNPDGRSFTHYLNDPSDPASLSGNNIAYLHCDSQKRLWVAVDHGGLNLYESHSDSFIHYNHNSYNENTLSSDSPRYIYEDDLGNLWIGMFPTGVTFLDKSAAVFSNYAYKPNDVNSLTNSSILAFKKDSQGILWIGTEDGLNSFDRKTGQIKRYFAANASVHPELSMGAILAIEEDVKGNLWLGTWSGGLYRYNPRTDSLRHYTQTDDPTSLSNPFVWKILQDSTNTIWIATETGGLNRYDPASDSFIHYRATTTTDNSIISNQVWNLLEYQPDEIWIATLEGLDRFNKATGTFTHFLHDPQRPESISSNQIVSLFKDSRGYLWVGTRDAGVNRWNPVTNEFTRLDVRQGMPSSTASSIIEDDKGNIWVSTVNGLAKINPNTFSIKAYLNSHGLVSNNFNRDATFKDADGKLYVGSADGMSIFDPYDIRDNSKPPKVVLTDFRVLNRSVTINAKDGILPKSILVTDKVVLHYQDTMFAFDFAALDFRSTYLHQYAYQLEGFDQDWIQIGNQRTATYTNMNPGHYVFRVKAANRDGVWNDNGVRLDLHIIPPMWQTWWAYLGYVFALVLGLYLMGRYRDMRTSTNIYRVLSITDQLTGITNRTGMLNAIEDVFVGRKIHTGIGLLIIDLDHFKLINDNRGHDAGDRVLKEFSALIAQHIRAGDKFARWGGEEFVLLCLQVELRGLVNFAEKLRTVVVNHVFDKAVEPLTITISIGVASVKPNETFDEAFKRADLALYDAKKASRNRVVVAE